ncbi:MAG: hypothetical protein ACRDRI_12245 [Pseudonocardiaceae bacterium]
MRSSKRDKDEIRAYVEHQAHEQIVHLEKVVSELVGPVWHNIWDAHCAESRWWVVTNPTKPLQPGGLQEPRCSDVVLTFRIGLMLRVEYAQEHEVPVVPTSADFAARLVAALATGVRSVRQR